MNKNILEFVEELKQRPEVLGVILFGSWARGNNRSDSDVDLVVILDDGYRRTVEYKNNQAFEIIYTTEDSAIKYWQSHRDDCAGLWEVAKIVYDKDGTIDRVKTKASEVIKEGKKMIDDYQVGQYKFSAEDEIKAVEALLGKDMSTASLVLEKTVLSLAELFFDLRRIWTPAPKQRLAKINEISPEFYSLIFAFYKERIGINEKISLAKEMIPVVFKFNEEKI